MRNEKLILDEIKALEKVLPRIKKVAAITIFNDDNVAAIEAQIKVLKEGMDEDDIYDEWPIEFEEEHIHHAAQDVLDWIEGTVKDAVSIGWKQLADAKEKMKKAPNA